MTDEMVTYRASRVKSGLWIVIAILFLYGGYQLAEESVWIGAIASLLSGAVAILLIVYFVDPTRYTITANPPGLEVRDALRIYSIPWGDIDHFFVNSGRGGKRVAISYSITAQKRPITSMAAIFNAPIQTIVDSLNNYRESHAERI